MPFYLIADAKSPADFQLEGCRFFGLADQRSTGLRYANVCPEGHYARKNIGYLLAIRDGATVIVETDDDNHPTEAFWNRRSIKQNAELVTHAGWVNAYRWYTDLPVWPRGFPLDLIRTEAPVSERAAVVESVQVPIQQGLASGNPDVDAIYRFVCELPIAFERDCRLAFGSGSWCPFNSQNTTWFAPAFKLMYLPAYCSFRMTDIWRSFIAQRIAWANGWHILFHGPTVEQLRNGHDLLADFRDEIPGYLNNARIASALDTLNMHGGSDRIDENLRVCYELLVRMDLVKPEELRLLDAWIEDSNAFTGVQELRVETA